jgi:[ribosomal protein S5]-alanine N-acetyltransferase
VLTERLSLLPVAATEVEHAVRLWTDPVVTRHIGGPRSPEPVREHFQRAAADPEAVYQEDGDRWWSIFRRDTDEWIGLCALLGKEIAGRSEVELGYFFLPHAWGHGFAAEAAACLATCAFEDLAIPSLIALIDPQNARSVGVAVHIGMTLEASIPRPGGHVRKLYRLYPPSRSTVHPAAPGSRRHP